MNDSNSPDSDLVVRISAADRGRGTELPASTRCRPHQRPGRRQSGPPVVTVFNMRRDDSYDGAAAEQLLPQRTGEEPWRLYPLAPDTPAHLDLPGWVPILASTPMTTVFVLAIEHRHATNFSAHAPRTLR